MPTSDRPTLATLRASARRYLLDPNSRWWPDTELNDYIADWQYELQAEFEWTWGTVTFISTASSFSIPSQIAQNLIRIGRVYIYDGTSTSRLVPQSIIGMDTMQRNWRNQDPSGLKPNIYYQEDSSVIGFWPPSTNTYTYIIEAPIWTTLTSDLQTMDCPPWVKYSANDYVMYRALSRFGPNQNLQRALRYKQSFQNKLKKFRRIYDGYFPEKFEVIRPGRKNLRNLLTPRHP